MPLGMRPSLLAFEEFNSAFEFRGFLAAPRFYSSPRDRQRRLGIYRRLIACWPNPDTYVDLNRADPPSERRVAHDRNALATAGHRLEGSGARHAVTVAVRA